MTARISFIFRMVFMGVVSLWMLSCAPQPELEWVPEIRTVSAEVVENTCGLTAVVTEGLSEEYAVGFLYGRDEDNMQSVVATIENGAFNSFLASLEYDSEYVYKAYISNGRNMVYSDMSSFRTEPVKDNGSEEGGSEEGGSENEEECVIILPFHDITVKSWEKEFMMEIGGDAEFVVNIPQEAVWLKCRRSGRTCVFQFQPNKVLADRSCKVVFRNLRNDQTDTLNVCQTRISIDEGNLPFNEVDLLSGNSSFTMTLPNLYSMLLVQFMPGQESAGEWLRWGFSYSSDNSMVNIHFDAAENTTDEERIGWIIITYDGRESLLVVIQKQWNSIVQFKDPGIRKVCVDAFDLDGDGNLTCYEIHAVPYDGMDYLDFSKVRIKSFDEFRWFTSVSLINQPVFAGTGLESISFPRKVFILQNGVFKNCTELKDVDLTSVTVSDEAFMGCTNLKDVRAVIIGKSAFEGCTGLETVVQLFSDVPPFAFRQCTSLHSFEFEIINIPGGTSMHIIGEEAFRNCTSLPEITIPYLTTEIHDRAFYGCSSMSAVYMDPLVPPTLGEDVFAGTSTDLKIFVPSESVGLYKESWPSLADRIDVR